MQPSSFAVIFLLVNFHQSPTSKEYDFFPYKVVISFFPKTSGQFLTKHLRKVWENVLFYNKFNQFAIRREELTNSLMGNFEKQTVIQRAFMEQLTQIHQIPKLQISIFQ
jgi:hypothetical protein